MVGAAQNENWQVLSLSIGFQARKSALDGHRRAVAIDDTEVCQKPMFASFGVSTDFLKLRTEIGVCDDGKIRQWKSEPITGALQESLLTRPAGKEARHAEMIRQRPKSGALAN